MSVFSRDSLEGSPLADLHAIASELGLEGFRRLRKADLIKAIIIDQGGDPGPDPEPDPVEDDETDAGEAEKPARASRSRRGGSRSGSREGGDSESGAREGGGSRSGSSRGSDSGRSGGRSGGREGGRGGGSERSSDEPERTVEGTVEVLGNGSAFVRVKPPGPSDEDVYVSAAQVRRCELVTGDKVSGPARAARRSERYPSLVRVVTINDRSADEVSVGTPYDKLDAAFATKLIGFSGRNATLKAIAASAPFGRGSRVSVVGPFASGRTTTLRMLAAELAATDEIELSVVLSGSRPEESAEWVAAAIQPASIQTLNASADAQTQAIERVIEAARRVTASGGHSAVLIDSLDDLPATVSRRLLGAARNVPGAGSLTVIAAVRQPVGGETTLIYLAAQDGGKVSVPAVDKAHSKTLRSDRLSA